MAIPGVFNARRPLSPGVLDRIEHLEAPGACLVRTNAVVGVTKHCATVTFFAGEKALIEPL
jgi:hypothetical protein